MKKLKIMLMLTAALITAITMASCSEEEVQSSPMEKSGILTMLDEYNSSMNFETRATIIDDGTEATIVKADLLGAFEGAMHGIDYAIDKELNPDDAITVIIASAIAHSFVRSHQAYIELHHGASAYYCSAPDAFGNKSLSDAGKAHFQSLSEQAIVAYKSDLISESTWMETTIGNQDKTYENAWIVARSHNALLSIFNRIQPVSNLNSFIDENYNIYEKDYFLSSSYTDNFMHTVSNPTNFLEYANISTSDSHYVAKQVIANFLNAIDDLYGNYAKFDSTMQYYISAMIGSNELDTLEKEALLMSFMVGEYSNKYWSELQ